MFKQSMFTSTQVFYSPTKCLWEITKYELQIINENLWKNARKKTLQTDDWLI